MASLFLFYFSCSNPYVQGERLYELRCANCHMSDGSGLAQVIPDLTATSYKSRDLEVACLIRNGLPGNDQLVMPANKDLTPAEITNIINFLRTEFWDDSRFAQPEKVVEVIKDCE